jgi:hypothetical protein
MGKKQHQKDRLFLTSKVWKEEWGGYQRGPDGVPKGRLPFSCCAITFTPFEDPVRKRCLASRTYEALWPATQQLRDLAGRARRPASCVQLMLRFVEQTPLPSSMGATVYH